MIRVILILLFFVTGCKTTSGPNLSLELEKLTHHPVVVIRTRDIKDISDSKVVWVDFDFELKEWKERKSGMTLRPFNIVAINTSHPSSKYLIPEAIKAFEKWEFQSKHVPNYNSKRFNIRSVVSGLLHQDGFDCKSSSCIKK